MRSGIIQVHTGVAGIRTEERPMIRKIYFVGNAHLDPVWMWRWQEGSAEAKATIRSALDRMKEYPEFRFVCSASAVFRWIETFDPEMFAEIAARVREGRFVPVGGWIVQPDCNLPGGEGFARQTLYGQRYFHDHFGVCAKVGYNVDSFGHHGMLPQILQKSGMRYYTFMRPEPHEKALPGNLFRWRAPDGSEVIACRLLDKYCHNIGSLEELEADIASLSERNPQATAFPYFYGVGNHGGGPTKRNIELILAYREKHPEVSCIFSDLSDFFAEAEKEKDLLPLVTEDLQHHASGCYSAVSAIKTAIRRAENRLLSAEVSQMLSATLLGRAPETGTLAKAWEPTLFCQFHDIFGGCAIEDAYRDAAEMTGESLSVAARLQNNALQSISWAIGTMNISGDGVPTVLFNCLPFPVSAVVQVNRQAEGVIDGNGKTIPMQHVHSQSRSCRARYDTIFRAEIPAFGYSVYTLLSPKEAEADLTLRAGTPPTRPVSAIPTLESRNMKLTFDPETGVLTSAYDKQTKRELLNGRGAIPVVIDETEHDTWSHGMNYFDREIGAFGDAEFTLTEEGAVRSTMKVSQRCGNSTLTQYFHLEEDSRGFWTEAYIDWHEAHKLLKLRFETAVTDPHAFYEIPFGVIERPTDGEEEPGYRWIAVRNREFGCALLNDNKYSFSIRNSDMELTVVRSPIYGDHGNGRDAESRFTDQGEHSFSYRFLPIDETAGWEAVVAAARLFNTPPISVIENRHAGTLPTRFCGMTCDAKNVQISAWKRAEDQTGTVLRLYETDGKQTAFCIFGDALRIPLKGTAAPYSVDTYYLPDAGNEWIPVSLAEL